MEVTEASLINALREEINLLRADIADKDDSILLLSSSIDISEKFGRDKADKQRVSEISFKNQEIHALQNENRDLRRELETSRKLSKVETNINHIKVEQIVDNSDVNLFAVSSISNSKMAVSKDVLASKTGDNNSLLGIGPLLTALKLTRSNLSNMDFERSENSDRCSNILGKALTDVTSIIEAFCTIKFRSSFESSAGIRLHARCIHIVTHAALEIFGMCTFSANSKPVGRKRFRRSDVVEYEVSHISRSLLAQILSLVRNIVQLMPTMPSYGSQIFVDSPKGGSNYMNTKVDMVADETHMPPMKSLNVDNAIVAEFSDSRERITRLLRKICSEDSAYMIAALENLALLITVVSSEKGFLSGDGSHAFEVRFTSLMSSLSVAMYDVKVRTYLVEVIIGMKFLSSAVTFTATSECSTIFDRLLISMQPAFLPASVPKTMSAGSALLSALCGLVVDTSRGFREGSSSAETEMMHFHRSSLLRILRESMGEQSVFQGFLIIQRSSTPSFISSLLSSLSANDALLSGTSTKEPKVHDSLSKSLLQFQAEILLFLERILQLHGERALSLIMHPTEDSDTTGPGRGSCDVATAHLSEKYDRDNGKVDPSSSRKASFSASPPDTRGSEENDPATALKALCSLLLQLHRELEQTPPPLTFAPLVHHRSRPNFLGLQTRDAIHHTVEVASRLLDKIVVSIMHRSTSSTLAVGGAHGKGSAPVSISPLLGSMNERMGALLMLCRGGYCDERFKVALIKNCRHFEKLLH